MTTVACDGKTMSADGRGTTNNTRVSDGLHKLFRSWDGKRVIGISGETCVQRRFAKWLCRPTFLRGAAPNISGGVIELHPDGRILSYQSNGDGVEVEAPFAIGSGADFAIGAMLNGADTKEAVAIAAKRDVYTGGNIQTMQPKIGAVS